MEPKNINIRLIQDSDIDLINEFHNRIYQDNRTKEDFIWEFYNAPAGKAIYIVAEDLAKNKIIGTQCAIPIILKKADGKEILSGKSEDTLVDPEYRGMQLFEKMYSSLFSECRKSGINYIWGFTPALKPFIKIGFEAPYLHHQSLMTINIIKSYKYLSNLNPKNSAIDKFKIFVLTLISKVFSFQKYSASSSLRNVQFKTSYKVESDLDTLTTEMIIKDPELFLIKLNQSYIEWRINKNPNHQRVFSIDVYNDGALIANYIFNQHKNDVWYLIQSLVSNSLCIKDQAKITRKAIHHLLKTEKVALIRTWNFSTNNFSKKEIKIYRRSGLFYIPKGVSFVWKDLKEENELNPHNFILSRIATQGII